MKKEHSDFWAALDEMVKNHRIVIDRPAGTAHPRYPDMIYPVDYGYLQNTSSMDGGGIDLWRGTNCEQRIDAILCTVDLRKNDSEIKILIGCSEEEKEKVLQFHNSSQSMKAILIQRSYE